MAQSKFTTTPKASDLVNKINGLVDDIVTNKYTHPNSGVTAGTYRSVTVNAQGHVTGGSNPILPIDNGGTGATTANDACANIGALPLTGGAIKNPRILYASSNATHLEINGGTNFNSPSLVLTPAESTEGWQTQDSFLLHTKANKDLIGIGDGTLKWCNVNVMLPIGIVLPYAGINLPADYLACNGSAISRTTYKPLFDIIGTTYGAGDGSTTFNLPNLIGKMVQGSGNDTVGTVKSAGLPNIKGTYSNIGLDWQGWGTDAISHGTVSSYTRNAHSGSATETKGLVFNASNYNSIYSDDINTVQPPAIIMRYIIKYQ